MTLRQISVFIENKPGTMVKITEALGNVGIDIRAASLADTQDFGILRLIVDDADKAKKALTEIGCVTSVNDVIAAEVSDEPGAMTALLNQTASTGLNIEYMYAFISPKTHKVYIVLRIKDVEKAVKVLSEAGIALADESDIK
ncbi:MAG: ACT domain-containing protein [Ruminococcaceae bacterium]|nr:ACT domain-containing protein [Oscillospiraceae bacterium]MBQ9693044.1 ACT domain-containing protein [Clostridia bacterium]